MAIDRAAEADVLESMHEADAAVVLGRLVEDRGSVPPGWASVLRADGLIACTPTDSPAALAAAAALDLSAGASRARRRARDDAGRPGRKALREQAAQAVADIDAYLVIADAATPAQVRAAVKRLSQMMRAVIIRLNNID